MSKIMKISDNMILELQQEKDIKIRKKQLVGELLQEMHAINEVKDIETDNKNEEIDEKISKFFHGKSVSENLLKILINNGPTDEYIRLLKDLNFNDDDVEKLRDLWQIKTEINECKDFAYSLTSEESNFSQNGLYLKKVLSKPLIEALREIVAKKPTDPVEYLGYWLLHFKMSEEWSIRRKEQELKLLINGEKKKIKEIENNESFPIEQKEEEEPGEDWNYVNYGEL